MTNVDKIVRTCWSRQPFCSLALSISISTSDSFRPSPQARRHADALEHELSKEWQNGRLLRVAVKMNACVDRPEHDLGVDGGAGKAASDTSERFLIKLFRNFVFHQQHEDGTPNLDFGHVVYMLNKLDAGSAERVALMGRDEEHLMVRVCARILITKTLVTGFGLCVMVVSNH